MKRIVILGAGTGGTLVANRLRRACGDRDVSIQCVDHDDRHVYQPGLLFVPFGMARPEDIVRSRRAQLHEGIEFHVDDVERVDLVSNAVQLTSGRVLDYDILVVATGAVLSPEETEGLAESWSAGVHSYYTLESALALESALTLFDGGRLVVNLVEMPIKCPVSPLEFCFLADSYFHERKIRDGVSITYVTPLDAAFTKPISSQHLAGMLAERHVEMVTEFNTARVDGPGRKLVSYDDRVVNFDLAVVIPAHSGAPYVTRSKDLGDALGFIDVDPHTLQAKCAPNVFVIGDAAGVPTSKAGSVTHFEGDVVVRNVLAFLDGRELDGSFDGHSNCFIETGFSKAMLIDFNYEVEPETGHYPAAVGLSLLKETRLNHLGKLMFQWLYWHVLLAGREIPGISGAMPLAGKHAPRPKEEEVSS
jgi:sulfide:quinone oxidoreductase